MNDRASSAPVAPSRASEAYTRSDGIGSPGVSGHASPPHAERAAGRADGVRHVGEERRRERDEAVRKRRARASGRSGRCAPRRRPRRAAISPASAAASAVSSSEDDHRPAVRPPPRSVSTSATVVNIGSMSTVAPSATSASTSSAVPAWSGSVRANELARGAARRRRRPGRARRCGEIQVFRPVLALRLAAALEVQPDPVDARGVGARRQSRVVRPQGEDELRTCTGWRPCRAGGGTRQGPRDRRPRRSS